MIQYLTYAAQAILLAAFLVNEVQSFISRNRGEELAKLNRTANSILILLLLLVISR